MLEELTAALERPCDYYTCPDAAQLQAMIADLHDQPESWRYLHEAAISRNGREIPYILIVHHSHNSIVFGSELPDAELQALCDQAVAFLVADSTTRGGR
ncbi:MAG: hypothetical protein ACOCXA_03105 [Planctomycetota bacterium]